MNAAKTIRTELKATLNLNSRQVSVRSTSGAIYVTVKVPTGIEPIRHIANKHRSVRYCEHTNEILQGGNTFVFVSFCSDMIEKLAAPFLAVIESADYVRFGDIHVSQECRNDVRVYGLEAIDQHGSCYDNSSAAELVVREMIELGLEIDATETSAPVAVVADDAHTNMLEMLGC